MSRQLTAASTLESLKHEAKRWLKALRAGDHTSRERFHSAHPQAPNEPGLRDVQHALAREHGFTSWAALKEALADRAGAGESHDRRVARFLKDACPDWRVGGAQRHSMARHTAERLLQRYPDIARHSIYTAVACSDLGEVTRLLTERPALASARGGPRTWEPLLYLCAARISVAAPNDNAVAIARALLDHGADPNAYYAGGSDDINYTALTAVVGGGEEDAPRHPQYQALAELLLERGAEPYDVQVFYNTHFRGDILWLMQLIYTYSVKRGRPADWNDPEWSMIDMGGYGLGARYVLGGAVARNDLALAEWCLTHGASPEPAQPPHPRMRTTRTLYEEAVFRGHSDMARLLARHGARESIPALEGVEEFASACMLLDRARARALAETHPEYLESHVPMFTAVRRDRVDALQFLLELGASPEVEDSSSQRPLHVAVSHDALLVAQFLLDRGVEVDHRESNWGATPLAWAVYGMKWPMIDRLTPYTRDVWNLAFAGKVERLRELFTTEPGLAKVAHPGGDTPLMRLPDDEARAIEIAELFLLHGADPKRKNAQGETAADLASQRGLDVVAALLRVK